MLRWLTLKQSRTGTCSYCGSPILARRMCGKHYQRWAKWGDPLKTVNLPSDATPEEKLYFYGWTVTTRGCWEWKGYRFPRGYGRVPVGNTTVGAHVVAYETWVGPIPDGLLVRHTCDNPPCINPKHLLVGTHQDNMDDKVQRQRQSSLKGEAHYAAKLTAEDVRKIRSEWSEGNVTQPALAKKYGTTYKNIHMIVHRKTWRHIDA